MECCYCGLQYNNGQQQELLPLKTRKMCTSQTKHVFAKVVFTVHLDWFVLLDLIIFTGFNAVMYLQFFIVRKQPIQSSAWICLSQLFPL